MKAERNDVEALSADLRSAMLYGVHGSSGSRNGFARVTLDAWAAADAAGAAAAPAVANAAGDDDDPEEKDEKEEAPLP